MTLEEALHELQSLGSEKVRQFNVKQGISGSQFGVKMGDIRVVAKKAKTDHELAMKLWGTSNFDAQLLAILIMKPRSLTRAQIDEMVKSIESTQIADWFNSYVVKLHPEKEDLRLEWMAEKHPMAARAGWSLTTERICKDPDGLDITGILDRIESDMANEPEQSRWTMNYALAEIGIKYPEYRERAIGIGKKLGIYKDYPVSKGCVSPYAPIWIAEMVSRQK